jgi:vacuolar-type H+-ATPase subunit E/Vma4
VQRERLAEARSEARRIVLRARQEVLADASRAAHMAARELVSEPAYAELMTALTAEVKERLATPAERVSVAAAPDGGLLARAGSHEIDYSLDSQVDRCMQAMSGELERLWR